MKHILAALALSLPLTLNAQEAQNAALPFTRIDRNPRTSAFAGAGVASTNASAWGALNNAAQLSFIEGMGDAAFGFQLWQPSNDADKTTNFGGGAAFRFGDFAVALAGVYDKCEPFAGYNPSDLLLSLGASYNILDVVSVGLNARYASQNLAQNAKLSGFSADLSIIGRIMDGLTAGFTVGNIGPKVKGSVDSYGQPAYARLGVAWNKTLAEKHGLELLLDGEYNFGSAAAVSVGAEYNFNRLVYARVGYRYAGEKALIPSHLGAGIGLQFKGFRLDASYLTASEILGNTINVGLGYSF
ncbi:MAG: PorV/PorQ family protein [Bacteroidales bacterium]|nr:PorV/PorQ family protein [Bacteroidales bacterium]